MLFLFSFWHLYDWDVGKFKVVPEVLFCRCSRLGKFTQDSDRWKKIHRAVRMSDTPLFWGGEIHMHCKLQVAPREVPTPLYTKCTQASKVPILNF